MVDFVIIGGVALIVGIIIGFLACVVAISIACEEQEMWDSEEEDK